MSHDTTDTNHTYQAGNVVDSESGRILEPHEARASCRLRSQVAVCTQEQRHRLPAGALRISRRTSKATAITVKVCARLSLSAFSWFQSPVAATNPQQKQWTIKELLTWTIDRFSTVGITHPRVDAEHLLSHALACKRIDLYFQHDRLLDEPEKQRFRVLVKKRLSREPVAYILETRGFHALDLELHVDARVLIPRPETEHLVDWALERLPNPNPIQHDPTPDDEEPSSPIEAPSIELSAQVLDVGTGSGAIALAIQHARPYVQVVASDLSTDALALARKNAQTFNLEIDFVESNLLQDILIPDAGFDLITANLPYIPHADLATLEPEVKDFEPLLALDGGEDGLELVRTLVTQVAQRKALRPGGSLFLEIGIDQAAQTALLLQDAGFIQVESRKDYGAIERVVAGIWPDLPR